MTVYVSADSGNVFIRSAPERGAPSVKIPAYNYKQYGVLYEVAEVRDNSGEIWLRLRGFGWAMGKFFSEYKPGETPAPDEDETRRWLCGLDEKDILECINYLKGCLNNG